MVQILFIVSLFIIVLLALEMEVLLVPNVVFLVLGAASLIFGIILFGYGKFRKRSTLPEKPHVEHVSSSDGKKPKAPSGCLSAVIGGMYVLIGIGILVLQLIGYHYLK